MISFALAATLAGLADAWAAAIWRASWQGGIALAMAWLITRAVARMPAAVKCWVWRVAYLKLLVTLMWSSPISLPLLPAKPARPAPVAAAIVPVAAEMHPVRLMLAHELAHLKRRDLWWNWLPVLGQALFFFHPLVWLAGHEWRLAQESACDEAAVGATGASPAQYGDMLLGALAPLSHRLRVFQSLPATAAAGVVESPRTVRRRLTAMRYFNLRPARPSPLRRGLVFGCACVAAVLSLVPLRLVATEPAAQDGTERLDVKPDAEPGGTAKAAESAGQPAPDEETLLDLGTVSYLKSPEAVLGAAADGIVKTVRVEEGQRVKLGEVLVELDSARAVAELEVAKGDFELKRVELQRKQAMFKRGGAVNEAEVVEAEVGVKRAQSVLALKEHELAQARVVAPFDGVVARVDARPGVFLGRGSPAVELVQADTLWAEVMVPPAGLAVLKKGVRAELMPTGVPDEAEKIRLGRVASISPILRPGSQTATVRVQLDRPAPDLRPGTNVRARFLRDKPAK